jgi:hypothetical protein
MENKKNKYFAVIVLVISVFLVSCEKEENIDFNNYVYSFELDNFRFPNKRLVRINLLDGNKYIIPINDSLNATFHNDFTRRNNIQKYLVLMDNTYHFYKLDLKSHKISMFNLYYDGIRYNEIISGIDAVEINEMDNELMIFSNYRDYESNQTGIFMYRFDSDSYLFKASSKLKNTENPYDKILTSFDNEVSILYFTQESKPQLIYKYNCITNELDSLIITNTESILDIEAINNELYLNIPQEDYTSKIIRLSGENTNEKMVLYTTIFVAKNVWIMEIDILIKQTKY